MFKELRERTMRVLGLGPRQRARLYHLRSEAEVEGLAHLLHGSTALPETELTREIETLRALPQSSLYLQIQQLGTLPFEVQLLPAHDGRLSLRLTVDAKRLEWGYTFPDDVARAAAEAGDGEGGEAAPPPPPPTPHPEVIALCVTGGREPKYTVKVPPSVAHATVVARDRVIAASVRLSGITEPVKFQVP